MSILSLDVKDNIATLTINSPPANALSTALIEELNQQLNAISKEPAVKAVIIKGEGRFFSAGADIKEFTQVESAEGQSDLSRNGQKVFHRIDRYPLPVIAAIHGAALGGGLELAMACHMRIVTKTAKLGLPETTLGIIPGFAGTQRLPQHVGSAKAYELILTGEPVSGEEAAAIGLANHAVNEEDLLSTAQSIAEKIAAKSKPSIEKVMELVPYAKFNSFDEGVLREAEVFGEIFSNEDAKEGIQAFIEKREAQFIDK